MASHGCPSNLVRRRRSVNGTSFQSLLSSSFSQTIFVEESSVLLALSFALREVANRRLVQGGSSISGTINNGKSCTSNSLLNRLGPNSFELSQIYRDNDTEAIAVRYMVAYMESRISSMRVRFWRWSDSLDAVRGFF